MNKLLLAGLVIVIVVLSGCVELPPNSELPEIAAADSSPPGKLYLKIAELVEGSKNCANDSLIENACEKLNLACQPECLGTLEKSITYRKDFPEYMAESMPETESFVNYSYNLKPGCFDEYFFGTGMSLNKNQEVTGEYDSEQLIRFTSIVDSYAKKGDCGLYLFFNDVATCDSIASCLMLYEEEPWYRGQCTGRLCGLS